VGAAVSIDEEERVELVRLLTDVLEGLEPDDPRYDAVADVLDWATGWCPPHLRIEAE
jgi:hypothetical protein